MPLPHWLNLISSIVELDQELSGASDVGARRRLGGKVGGYLVDRLLAESNRS